MKGRVTQPRRARFRLKIPLVLLMAGALGACGGEKAAPDPCPEPCAEPCTEPVVSSAFEPAKVDILLVMDNSVSLSQEQNAFAVATAGFVEKLRSLGEVDLRVAVITTDGLSQSERGKFHHKLPEPFPPNSLERRVVACETDSDCEELLADCVPTPSKWVCETQGQGAMYLQNANGSINTTCRFRCETDADCAAELEPQDPDSTFQCKAPGNDQSLRGCLKPPAVQGCPSELPELVDAATAEQMGTTESELFGCLAVVGALQDQNPQLEQGLKTSVLALDPSGPNAAQAAKFVRPDAWQLVVYVSDEEDCSFAKDIPKELRSSSGSLLAEYWAVCGLLGDTAGEGPLGEDLATSPYAAGGEASAGPLEPVSSYVEALRSVNPDPSRVLVAAIVGGVVVAEPAVAPCDDPGGLHCPDAAFESTEECLEDRIEQYLLAQAAPGPLARLSYVCAGPYGKANWGGRYLRLVDAFGSNGIARTLCDPRGIDRSLEDIGEWAAGRVNRICLKTTDPVEGAALLADGTRKPLVAGADYDVVDAVLCESGKAAQLRVATPAATYEFVSQPPTEGCAP